MTNVHDLRVQLLIQMKDMDFNTAVAKNDEDINATIIKLILALRKQKVWI